MIELTKTIGALAYFRIYQKPLKDAFINSYQHTLMGYFVNNNVDLERVSMSQHSLLKWRQSLDQGLVFCVLLKGLSKGF